MIGSGGGGIVWRPSTTLVATVLMHRTTPARAWGSLESLVRRCSDLDSDSSPNHYISAPGFPGSPMRGLGLFCVSKQLLIVTLDLPERYQHLRDRSSRSPMPYRPKSGPRSLTDLQTIQNRGMRVRDTAFPRATPVLWQLRNTLVFGYHAVSPTPSRPEGLAQASERLKILLVHSRFGISHVTSWGVSLCRPKSLPALSLVFETFSKAVPILMLH